MCQRSDDPALQELLGCRETFYLRSCPCRVARRASLPRALVARHCPPARNVPEERRSGAPGAPWLSRNLLSQVLPVPGGPKSITAAGARSPTLSASSECARGATIRRSRSSLVVEKPFISGLARAGWPEEHHCRGRS